MSFILFCHQSDVMILARHLYDTEVFVKVGFACSCENKILILIKNFHRRSHGGSGRYVPPLFENMGLVICPNLHRNRVGLGD